MPSKKSSTQTKVQSDIALKLAVASALIGFAAVAAAALGSVAGNSSSCATNETHYVSDGTSVQDGPARVCEGDTIAYTTASGETAYFYVRGIRKNKAALFPLTYAGYPQIYNVNYKVPGAKYIILPLKKTVEYKYPNKGTLTYKIFFRGVNPKTGKAWMYFGYESTLPTCTDSDGGADEYAQGVASGWNSENDTVVNWQDHCSPATVNGNGATGVTTSSGAYMYESVCQENEVVYLNEVKCDYGCNEGVCLPEPPHGTLSIIKNPTVVDGEILAGVDVTIGSYRMSAVGSEEDVCLTDMLLDVGSSADKFSFLGDTVYIKNQQGEEIGHLPLTDVWSEKGNIPLIMDDYCVDKGTKEDIKVTIDVDNPTETAGLQTKIVAYKYMGDNSGVEVLVTDTIIGQIFTIDGVPALEAPELTVESLQINSALYNGGVELSRFRVTNITGVDAKLAELNASVTSSGILFTNQYELWDMTENNELLLDTIPVSQVPAYKPALHFAPSASLLTYIQQGSPKTLSIRGYVTGASSGDYTILTLDHMAYFSALSGGDYAEWTGNSNAYTTVLSL